MTGTGPWKAQDSVEPIQADTIGAIANIATYNTVSGCAATYSISDMIVTIASGQITHNSTATTVAGNTVTLVSDPTNPRWTYIYVNSSGVAALVSGTAAATPAVPDTGANPTNQLVYVQAGLTVAGNATYKLDKRVMAVASYPSAAYAEMVQMGGGSLTAPTNVVQTGRVFLCNFNATASSASKSADTTDNLYGLSLGVLGGLLLYTSQTPSTNGTLSRELTATIGSSRVLNLTGGSAGASNFGLLTGYLQGDAGNPGAAPAAVAVLAPDRSPWMRVKMNPTSGGAANITTRQFGFFGSLSATANGAYLRRNTTGNLFFVTRQGGSETVVDLGAQTAAERWYDIYSPDAGVNWYYYDHTAATGGHQATNVPTAGTDLIVGHYVIGAAASQTSALSRIAVSYIDN